MVESLFDLWAMVDVNDDKVVLIKSKNGFFARISPFENKWLIFFYTEKRTMQKDKLSDALAYVEKEYKRVES